MTSKPTDTILGQISPDLSDHMVTTRRGLFTRTAAMLGAAASAPVLLAVASQQAFGQGNLPKEIVDVLTFALTLEHIEDAFYRTGLESHGLIPGKYKAVFQQIGLHEDAHVKLLTGALGSAAVKRPELDFTAGGKYADVFSNFETFAAVSQTFEDLGVAAYKGQAGNLISNGDILTVALQIHSVEARHAAEVRRLRGQSPWDGGAFDEPMTKEAVLAAATPFLKM